MAIEFTCPTCRQLVSTPDAAAGRQGRCPHCAAVVTIPAASTAAPASVPADAIEFTCGACQQAVSCPPTAAGRRGRCPHCHAVMQVPLRSMAGAVAASGPSAAEQAAQAQAAALAAKTDPWADLPVQVYTPGAKPLVMWDGGHKPAADENSASPNTSAEGARHWHAVLDRVAAEERSYRGLPWDDDTTLWSLRDTMFYLCTAPKEAFDDMHRKGGYAVPFTFLVFSHLMAQILPPGMLLAIGTILSLITGSAWEVDWLALFFVCGIYFLIALAAAVVGALLYSVVGTGLLHLFLVVQNAARESFEATFRIVCYSTGAASLLSATIVLAPLAPIMWFVLPVVGVRRVHRVPLWQAAITVVPATLLAVVAIVALFWLLILIVMGIAVAELHLSQQMWRMPRGH